MFLYLCCVALTVITFQLILKNQEMMAAYRESTMKHQSEIHQEAFDEPSSDEEFDPTKEEYTMTENPMLRHRNNHEEAEVPPID